ncbi:MAG: hypothetical protein QGF90_10495, partial [Gammaproteobacteria bacterium]|nr:hypothetical protein [Gammaproteobacteria bacterium]
MADNKPTPAGLGYSIDELITGAYKAYEEPEQSISEDITDSFSQTSANIHMSWDALMAGINEATGDYADADRRIQQAIEHGRKSAATAPSTQDLRDIESPGDFVSWLASNSGQLGYMVAGGVPGKIGGLLARGIASKAINRQIRKQLKDMGLGDDIVEAALKNPNLSANAAQALAQRAEVANRLYGKSLTKKNLAETVGTSAGYAAGFMGLETGLNVKDIFDETGTIEPGIAAKYGVPAGLLAAPMGAFYQRALNRNRLKGGSTDAEVQKGVGGILKQAGIGASGEMPIEMIQEATNIYAVREATGNTAPLTADEKWQIINAGAAAFAAGGMVTGGIEGYNKLKNTAYKTGQRIGDLLSAQPGLATENKVRSMLGDDINILGEQDSTIYVDPEGGASAPGAATGPVAPQWEEGSTVEFEVEEEAG